MGKELVELELPTDEAYELCVRASERVAWTVDEVLAIDHELDFTRTFMPEELVHLAAMPLADAHKLALNQIRANSYVNLFIFVEEYIIATAMRHAQAEQFGSPAALRALLRFAEEELKHQQLFRRFRDAFDRGFGHRCELLDNAVEAAGYILTKSALAVMLMTLQLELITQQHYVGAIKAAPDSLEPAFRRMFEFHWLEESQHARIDALEIAKLVADSEPGEIAAALDDYEDIVVRFDALLGSQAEMDVRTLERVIGAPLAAATHDAVVRQQRASYRRDFLHDGFENPVFARMLHRLDGRARLAALATRFA